MNYNAYGQRIGVRYTFRLSAPSSAIAMGTLMGYTKAFCYDQSGRLICERKIGNYYGEGTASEQTVFLYDESGIVGMMYTGTNGETATYYFRRNLLGDVIGIYNTNGAKVGGYAYDAWGNCTITLNTNGIATKNPIRYRGYYYDQDTGLYYLNARYYSPTWRRFISPDDTSYLDPEIESGLNLYCYCNDDPVNYADPSGYIAISTIIIGCLAAFAVGSAISAVSQGFQYGWDEISVGQVLIDGAFAAASVALAATGMPFIASVAVGAAMGLGQYAISTKFHNEPMTLQGVIISTVLGGIGGAVSGAGAKNLSTIASIYDDMTGRAAQGVKALITAAQRYGFGSKQFALVNNLYGKAIQSAVNQGIKKAFVGATIKITATTIANPFVGMGINSIVEFLIN
ncbi:MAG: RHS repeat-associated core domain-containing protein [Ruminococcaceae bacterium]|nr:RHS repeat-associated core domain-containing protein [Oscillospiraceae bacterium]